MLRKAPPRDPSLLRDSLAASGAGTWEHDVLHGRMHYCQAYASLYGLSPDDGVKGIPIDDLASKVHPDDRAHRVAECSHMMRHREVAVLRYRVRLSSGVTRWIMLRGRYEMDARTGSLRGRGIAIDITPARPGRCADGGFSLMTEGDGEPAGALDRAMRHLQAVSEAFRDLGAEGDARLWPAAEALLLEIAHQLAGTTAPFTPDYMRH